MRKLLAEQGQGRPHKYHAKRTTVDGIVFDSKAEASRYGELRLLEKAGTIRDLKVHVPFRLDYRGIHLCTYISDFVYTEVATGGTVVEDWKGYRTRIYSLKKKLMLALLGTEIRERGRSLK